MKKAALLLCLLMVCSMTACGSQQQEAENGKTLPADVSVTDGNTESAETENDLDSTEFLENRMFCTKGHYFLYVLNKSVCIF